MPRDTERRDIRRSYPLHGASGRRRQLRPLSGVRLDEGCLEMSSAGPVDDDDRLRRGECRTIRRRFQDNRRAQPSHLA